MPEHNRFEELCALAVTGQISASDSAELEAHLKVCETCRKAQSDFVEIESLWLSPAPEHAFLSHGTGSTLTQRILCRMQAAGARFSRPVLKGVGGRTTGFAILSLRSLSVPAYIAGALAMIAVGAILGAGLVSHRTAISAAKASVIATASATAPAAWNVPAAVTQSSAADAELRAARRSEQQLAQELSTAEAERSRTVARLDEAERNLAALQDARQQDAAEILRLRMATDRADAEAVDAQQQLARSKDIQASRDADFVAVQYRAREAEDKLAEQTAAIERERQLLSASREIRDVMGARNLHIVDVADVGGGGVKKPFGRVFYTEGKSLIFYAYDLVNPKGKQAFYAWGHREGDPHSTRMLGVVYNDDQAQKRWAFKFEDPKVLAEIDSVFVTLEPNDTPGAAPKGKKLLKAFLGTLPNHP
jgi:hypothetical protein